MKKLLAIVLAVMMLFTAGALAEGAITVSGGGQVNMAADMAYVTLGVSINDADVSTVMQLANERIDAICAALVENGLTEDCISTDYLYISPQYDYSGETNEIIGYSVNSGLKLRIDDVEAVGSYIDIAFAAGANSFDSITFALKDNSAARDEALRLAVADAEKKANVLAEASGMKLGDIVTIEENSSDSYYNTEGFAAKDAADAGMGTSVHPSKVSVSVQVQICYALEDQN